jgi:hypothetical protein
MARLVKLEAAAPPPIPTEPSGEQREEAAVWRYLSAVLFSTMPEPVARRVVAEAEAGPPYSALTERALSLVDRATPPPWTCSLDMCECQPYWAPLVLPDTVCAALDEGRASYDTPHHLTCSGCASELPHPWGGPCPVCGAALDRRGYLASPARRDWLAARAEALGRYRRGEPLTDGDRWYLDRRGYLATLCGARAPGAPAPTPMARADGGSHTVRFAIRHPEPDR